MRFNTSLIVFLWLLNVITAQNIGAVRINQSNITTLTTISDQNKKAIKGSSNDVDITAIYIYEDKSGYAWYASGTLRIFNSKYYVEAKCGFSFGEPSQSDMNNFHRGDINSTTTATKYFDIAFGSRYKIDNRFTCYACDIDWCWGRYKTFSPSTPTPTSSDSEEEGGISIIVIVAISVSVLIVICLCVCCCCIFYRSKTSMSERNGNLPVVTAGIPVTNNMNVNPVVNAVPVQNSVYEIPTISTSVNNNNNVVVTPSVPVTNNVNNENNENVNPSIPLNNRVVYAVHNPDGSIEYYAAAAITSPA